MGKGAQIHSNEEPRPIPRLNTFFSLEPLDQFQFRPLFTVLHRGSDNSPLPIVFSANYTDQSNRDSHATEGISEVLTF